MNTLNNIFWVLFGFLAFWGFFSTAWTGIKNESQFWKPVMGLATGIFFAAHLLEMVLKNLK